MTFDLHDEGLTLPPTRDHDHIGLVVIRGRVWMELGVKVRPLTTDEASQVRDFLAQAVDAISDAADH